MPHFGGSRPSLRLKISDAGAALVAWALRFRACLGDLPLLSRYCSYLFLLALLLVIFRVTLPQAAAMPNVGPLAMTSRTGEESSAATQVTPAGSGYYLQRSAAPLTVRTMREVLPMSSLQRTVRTSITIYRVEPGDSVLGIAEKFGLKGTSLLWANEKLEQNPDFLQIGQELVILPVDGVYHTVAKGETIESIAKLYKVEPTAITGYVGNNLKEPYTLEVGQKIIVPGGVKPYVPRIVQVYTGPVPQGAKKGSGRFVWPMSGMISQRYWVGHQAIDIAAPRGTTIVAADSGFVSHVESSNTGYGRMVIIDHGNGYQTLYAHLNAFYVEVGQSVAKGEAIGQCGSTGNSTGPHLHFEIRLNGVHVNPLNYLP